ncbi:MAG: phage tail protein [Pseudomonadota bacterium]
MATIAFAALGTVIGGPIGTAVGSFLGQQIDGVLFPAPGREGPRIKDLAVTTSSYGVPLARNFGRPRIPGTIIWSTDLIETSEKEEGGKGKPSTTTYNYSASFAVALSSTPLSRLGRIWADGNLLRGANGDLKAGGQLRFYHGQGDDPVDPLLAASGSLASPAYRDVAYVVFEELQLADFGNRIPALTFEVFGESDDTVPLSHLVPQVTADPGEVIPNALGYSDEGGAVVSTLSAIERVSPLLCRITGEGLQIGQLKLDELSALPLGERLAPSEQSGTDDFRKERADRVTSSPVGLRYYDRDRDYQPGVQRAIGTRSEGQESIIDIPATMTAGGARELANQTASRARWQLERMTWTTGQLDPRIAPGTLTHVPDSPGVWLISSWEWNESGVELGLERVSPTLTGQIGSEPGQANLPPDTPIGATELIAFEAPPLTSGGTANIVYAAASSQHSSWRGAALYLEQGDTLSPVGNTGARRAMVGRLETDIPPSPGLLFEPASAAELKFTAADLALSSTDILGIANGANRMLVGGEVLQFMHAEPVGDGNWIISGFLRGRGGTEIEALAGHGAGTSVVLLDDRLVEFDPNQIPSNAATRIAAIGLGDSEPVYSSINNVGLSLRPPSPVHPAATVTANGDLIVTWTRRSRGNWSWDNGLDVPIAEEQELYSVGLGPVDQPFAAWATAEREFVLASSDRLQFIADFGPVALWVRQIGTFGLSPALRIIDLS